MFRFPVNLVMKIINPNMDLRVGMRVECDVYLSKMCGI